MCTVVLITILFLTFSSDYIKINLNFYYVSIHKNNITNNVKNKIINRTFFLNENVQIFKLEVVITRN